MTGRCYCGAVALSIQGPAMVVAYCHCRDCKRWTGAPAPAFAAFAPECVTGNLPAPNCFNKGVERWNCGTCGSPLAARFSYLPEQVYIPVGILDDAADLEPTVHAHAEHELPWLHLNDGLKRVTGSSRDWISHSVS